MSTLVVPAIKPHYNVILKYYITQQDGWRYDFKYQKEWPCEDGIFESAMADWHWIFPESIVELIEMHVHPEERSVVYKVLNLQHLIR